MAEGIRTPIDQGMLSRAVAGIRYMLTGNAPNAWFPPGIPVQAQAQDKEGVKGRQFDFPMAVNINRELRQAEGGVTFGQLRNLADSYDLMRLMIETRKDQLEKLTWTVKPADEKKEPDSRCEELNKFFRYPDQEHDWNTWLRMVVEDLLVLDAPCLYPRMNLGGGLYGLEPVDGSTVKRIIDANGRTPAPPNVAYQQILKGIPSVDYNKDELIYRPRNVRTHKLYGYSPVEQVIMTVNIALRRQVHQLHYYTSGSVPDMLIGVPPDWNPGMISQFQEYWDLLLSGDLKQRRMAKFVPGGMTPFPTKAELTQDKMDEWLARIIAFAFSVSPQALIAQMNRATSETAQDQALQEGLAPLMVWIKTLIDYIIAKYFGYDDLCLKWDEEDDTSAEIQAKILTSYKDKGIMTADECREKLGLDPLTAEQKAELAPPPAEVDPVTGKPKPPAKPGAPGAGAATAAKPPAATEKGAYLGKALGSGRVKAISRTRATVRQSVRSLKKLLKPALFAARERLAGSLVRNTDKVRKGIADEHDAERLVAALDLRELRALAPDIADLLKDQGEDGARVALAQVLGEFSDEQLRQANDRAIDYARTRSVELVKEVEESTKRMMKDTIVQALEEGWSNDQLATELADGYEFSDERAMTIARTETAYADVEGNLAGYEASGVVDSKEWIAAQDEYCDLCEALNGKVVKLHESFPDGGGDGPPLHPNCRCDVLPVLKDE